MNIIKYRSFLILLLFNVQSLLAQDWGRIWCFGDSAGIDFRDPSMPVTFTSYLDCPRSNSSIGDSANGLLMYVNESYWPLWSSGQLKNTVIHNKFNSLVTNGDSLIGSFFDAFILIPKTKNDSIFYLFQRGFNPTDGLYYSIIDPYYNNNSGKVLQKNVQLPLTDPSLFNGVYCVRHGNGRDWWILTRNWTQSNKFNLFLVTPDSILGPFIQNIGSITNTDSGTMSISKQGDKLAIVDNIGLIEIYSFDRCSGLFSNTINISQNVLPSLFGSAFSPNGKLLYVSNTDNIFGGDSLRLWQFDLTDPNPASTKKVIYSEPVPASGGNLRLGPDDKIYLTCLYQIGWPYPDSCRNIYNENLSVINSPDSLGMACNFTPFSFYLGGKRTYWGLPNAPNYNLGPLVGSVCDSLFTDVKEVSIVNDFVVYPNPCKERLTIYCKDAKVNCVELFSSDLRLVLKTISESELIVLDISDLKEGIYILKTGENYQKVIVIK